MMSMKKKLMSWRRQIRYSSQMFLKNVSYKSYCKQMWNIFLLLLHNNSNIEQNVANALFFVHLKYLWLIIKQLLLMSLEFSLFFFKLSLFNCQINQHIFFNFFSHISCVFTRRLSHLLHVSMLLWKINISIKDP